MRVVQLRHALDVLTQGFYLLTIQHDTLVYHKPIPENASPHQVYSPPLMTLADFGWAIVRIAIMLGFLLSVLPVVIWLERRAGMVPESRGARSPGARSGCCSRWRTLQSSFSKRRLCLRARIGSSGRSRLRCRCSRRWSRRRRFRGDPNRLLTPVADVDIGVLYFLAMSSLAAYGVLLAGWSSRQQVFAAGRAALVGAGD